MTFKKRILLSVLITVAVIGLLWGLLEYLSPSKKSDVILLHQNWTVTCGGQTTFAKELNRFDIPTNLARGDTIVLEKKMDEFMDGHTSIRFITTNVAVEVFLDSDVIYAFGQDALAKKEMMGSGVHFIHLPPQVSGKNLRIMYTLAGNSSMRMFPVMEVMRSGEIVTNYFMSYSFSLVISSFLVVFGVLILFVGLFLYPMDRGYARLFMIGTLSLLMGIWALTYTKNIQLFSTDLARNTILEHIVLYMAPIPLSFLLYSIRRNSVNRMQKIILKAFCSLSILFFVTVSILHIFNIVQYSSVLPWFHTFVGVSFIFLVVGKLIYNKHEGLSEKLIAVGIAVFAVFSVIDMVRFNIYRYILLEGSLLSVMWIPIGTFLFILILMASFLVYLHGMITDKAERDVLANMAYTDSLTGVYNRAKCEQIFKNLNYGCSDYAIMSVDLNGLKKTNDTYGHAMGDKFIMTFAQVLQEAFDGIGISIRLGGDEFVEIVQQEHLDHLDEAVARMLQLQKNASSNLPISLSVSYGIAKHSEIRGSKAEDVYRKADSIMYEMKVRMNQARSSSSTVANV